VLPDVFMAWLGLAAIGAGVLTLAFHFGLVAQVVSFGVLTAAALVAGLRQRRPHRIPHTEREGLIGRPATALVFDGRDGRVRLGDTDWPARVPPDVPPPDPGARMRVEKVDGTVVIVRPETDSRLKEAT
jgi:membrane protein implicated in regulation of membrane protease activity